MGIGEKIKLLLQEKNMQAKELAEKIGIPPSTLSELVNGKTKKVSIQNGILIARELGCSVDYLVDDNIKNKAALPELNAKDKREIENDLETMLNALNGDSAALAMYNSPEDEEDKELLKASLLATMALAKQIAKKKYTPKKHRK